MNSGTMQDFKIISMNEILRPIMPVIITESVLYSKFHWGKKNYVLASGHDEMFCTHFR